ncbi:hypothetical protein PVAG01_07836 [Phlyctema vagabunda]|uniref:Uncharacterized protein n=1 Tax=Phlyctema vagabunda TaxID=108571 RepID=A0ABR4PDJ6_9HELO
MSDYPARPQTPQAMLHRLPDKPESSSEGATALSKFIILIIASTAVAGKVQIAKSVASALSCPIFQGDSLHETSAKAATVGAARYSSPADGDEGSATSGVNETRYQRMWLSKMTRSGLLFPEESRPANEDNSGMGGLSSTSTSRRGSSSSIASVSSLSDYPSSVPSIASSFKTSGPAIKKYANKPPILKLSEDEKLRKANPALMVVTHPDLEQWHKDSIRKTVGDYGIGVIFVPLSEDEELPILKPLDPRTMTSFASLGRFGAVNTPARKNWEGEIVLKVDVEAKVEDLIEAITGGVREIMNV